MAEAPAFTASVDHAESLGTWSIAKTSARVALGSLPTLVPHKHMGRGTICYNLKMAKETSDLPSWLGGCHRWRTTPPYRQKHMGRGTKRRAGRLAGDSSAVRGEIQCEEESAT